jgi:hypothetical protein
MFEYTHKNHFRFGYDGHWFATPADHHQEWQVELGQCTEIPLRFDLECRRAARLICENTPDLIPNIAFSGGIDSEVVVRSFVAEKLPFKITIFKFIGDLNLHDISFAISFCEERKLDYEIQYMDVVSYWKTDDFYRLADDVKCVAPQLVAQLNFFGDVDGLLILGQGEGCVFNPSEYEQFIEEHPSPRWFTIETERNMAMHRYFIQRNEKAIPAFFRYTPELMYSLYADSTVQKLVAGKLPGHKTTETIKFNIYKKYFPDLRPRPKFGGFERIDERHHLWRVLTKRMSKYTRNFLVPYKEMLEHLNPHAITHRSNTDIFVPEDEVLHIHDSNHPTTQGALRR